MRILLKLEILIITGWQDHNLITFRIHNLITWPDNNFVQQTLLLIFKLRLIATNTL
ncbi:hypothetical protein ES705_14975 [subsurface metagenome]